jgi:succinyl-diaminopimelate desuccinylase
MTRYLQEVRDWIDSRSEDIVGLLSRLVAQETENPPGIGLTQCAEMLGDEIAQLGIAAEVVSVNPVDKQKDAAIVRASVGDGPKTLYFHGHFDVVPVQDRKQFTLVRDNGRLIGRGTADMKGGIVSMLYGAAAASELGLLGNGKIVLHLVCDEETGSVAGSGHIRQAGLIDRNAVGNIWNAARSAVSLKITVHGREAHVGQAVFGVNSFEQMVQIAIPLRDYVKDLANRHTGFNMDGDDPRGSMVVIGGLSGGGCNFNVVPGKSWFTIDARLNPEEDTEVTRKEITSIIENAADAIGADVSVEVTQFQPSASTDERHQAGVALARCITEVQGAPTSFEMCAGILDIRWYAQLGIPAFAYGAGRLDCSHQPHEYVDELKLRQAAAVYALYAHEMLA